MQTATPVDLFLNVRGVAKRFGDNVVLAGVDLAVPRGSVVTVLGKSGRARGEPLCCKERDHRRLSQLASLTRA